MKPILNIADAPVIFKSEHGDAFAGAMAELGGKLGSKSIGANVTRVPPGKAAFPFHHHYANEEHFFIVSGSGSLRFGAALHPVKTGDYIVTPAGGPELAHQLINTGEVELVYLGISTLSAPEVVGYPDAAKTGVASVRFGESGPARFLIADASRNQVDYWTGEDGTAVSAIVHSAKKGP